MGEFGTSFQGFSFQNMTPRAFQKLNSENSCLIVTRMGPRNWYYTSSDVNNTAHHCH